MSGRHTNQSDPTAERTADQSTQSNSELGGASVGSQGGSSDTTDDVFNRNEEVRYDTPRRYEEEDASAPLYPEDDKD